MGLWSWLFPSREQRVAQARDRIERDPAGVLHDLHDLEGPDVDGLRRVARDALVRLNLDAAAAWADAGDAERVQGHLELAATFLDGDDRALRLAARAAQDTLTRRGDEADRARAAADAAKNGFVESPVPDFGDDAEATAARVALLVDGYPEPMREGVVALGPAFVEAVLQLDDGRPEVALLALLALPDTSAAVLYQRARCALALGDPAAAARALRDAATRASGDFTGPSGPTAVLRAEALAAAGRVPEALADLRAAREETPDLGGALYAHLLFAVRELPEADRVLRGLIERYPKESQLHLLLARVRRAGGYPMEAMRALEAAMDASCTHPGGRCGTRPPDPAIVRLLAGSYLEAGLDPDRAAELVALLRTLPPPPPSPEDAWLAGWIATRAGQAGADSGTSAPGPTASRR